MCTFSASSIRQRFCCDELQFRYLHLCKQWDVFHSKSQVCTHLSQPKWRDWFTNYYSFLDYCEGKSFVKLHIKLIKTNFILHCLVLLNLIQQLQVNLIQLRCTIQKYAVCKFAHSLSVSWNVNSYNHLYDFCENQSWYQYYHYYYYNWNYYQQLYDHAI